MDLRPLQLISKLSNRQTHKELFAKDHEHDTVSASTLAYKFESPENTPRQLM